MPGNIEDVAEAITGLAHAITPCAVAGHDDAGGHVESLTEAVMGNTAGLMAIAEAIGDLATAFRERTEAERSAGWP